MEKLNNLKPSFGRIEELNISKEVKENALATANHMPTRHNNRRKSICVSRPLSMKQSGKIKFAQLKRFSPEYNLLITEKNSLEQAAFWHEVKVVCCLLTPLLLLRIIQTISKHAL